VRTLSRSLLTLCAYRLEEDMRRIIEAPIPRVVAREPHCLANVHDRRGVALTLPIPLCKQESAEFAAMRGLPMKRSMFALAVLAVALPGFALAGEPVPMSDNDLDNTVAAGISITNLDQAIAGIRAHPGDFQSLVARNIGIFRQNEALVRRLLPADLHHLLPPAN
jgi:hypothetical protein